MNDALENLLKRPGLWRAGGGTADGAGIPPGISTGYPKLDRQLPGGGWPRHALTEILLEQYGTGELKLVMPALARLGRTGDGEGVRPVGKSESGWIAWIAPPFEPYAPALLQWGVDLARMLIVRPKQDTRRAPRQRDRRGQAGNDQVGCDQVGYDRGGYDRGGCDNEMLWAAEQALASGTCAAVLLWPRPIGCAIDHTSSRRLQLAAARGRSQAFLFRSWSALLQPSAAALRLKLEAGAGGTDIGILKSRGGRPRIVNHYDDNDAG